MRNVILQSATDACGNSSRVIMTLQLTLKMRMLLSASAYAPRRAHACKRGARAIECRRGRGRAGSGGEEEEEEEEEGESDRERTDRFVQ